MSTTPELKAAKQAAEIRMIERRAQLSAWNDYIGFGVSKVSGFALSGIGISELFSPDYLTIVLTHPSAAIGAGLALLGGPQLTKVLSKIMKGLES
jgi:hypothetical protein